MRKICIPLLAVIVFSACNKQETELITVSEVTRIYEGDVKKYGPHSCIMGQGGERVSIRYISTTEVFLEYHDYTGMPPLVKFPSVHASAITKKDGIWFFTIQPTDNAECRTWNTDTKTLNGINYNIAIHADGTIDGRMGYYDKKHPQGEQYLEFTGRRISR